MCVYSDIKSLVSISIGDHKGRKKIVSQESLLNNIFCRMVPTHTLLLRRAFYSNQMNKYPGQEDIVAHGYCLEKLLRKNEVATFLNV